MNISRSFVINLLIVLVASLLFFPMLGKVHLFDWDEANFAESAREMIVSGNYFNVQINFQIFWEKPPLFMWFQVLSMKMFGINEYAARFPDAVAGVITLLVLFNIGKKEFDEKFGLIWVLAYAGSILPHFYFKSGIIDPIFNLFIFLGLYHFARLTALSQQQQGPRMQHAIFAGFFTGLAVLTKGPVAFLIVGICVALYFLLKTSLRVIAFRELLIFCVITGLLSFAWFGIGMIKDGPYFIVRFIKYQIKLFSTEDAGHGGPFYYHFIILLLGCFPASVYIFKAFMRQYSDSNSQRNLKMWMMLSLFVVLILFSIVKTKIIHYSSFCYFPITFLAAYSLYKVYRHRTYFSRYFQVWFLVIGGLISVALILIPLIMKYRFELIERFKPYIRDEFFLENMKAPVEWSGMEFTIGAFYLAAIILATIYHYRNPVTGAVILFVSTIFTVQFTLYLMVPKIEEHVQGAVIDFYREYGRDKDVYIESIGFKSYADLFYANKKPEQCKNINNQEWLMHGDIDKPTYLARKINRNREMDNDKDLEEIGRKNGFVFYRRLPRK